MARTPRLVIEDVVYHVLNRANGRETIFQEEKDYRLFEKILFEGKEKYPINIYSFCIMPNHWHFVLSSEKGENIPSFMRWITHTHTQRWHASHKSIGCGHLYQGRYKSFPIEKDNHFLQVCRYVERNPLRAGIVQKAEDWQWSSLWKREHGTEKQSPLLSSWPVEKPDSYLEWTNTLLKDEEEKLKKIRYAFRRGSPYGRESWMRATAAKLNLNSTLNPRGRPKKGT